MVLLPEPLKKGGHPHPFPLALPSARVLNVMYGCARILAIVFRGPRPSSDARPRRSDALKACLPASRTFIRIGLSPSKKRLKSTTFMLSVGPTPETVGSVLGDLASTCAELQANSPITNDVTPASALETGRLDSWMQSTRKLMSCGDSKSSKSRTVA